jgi:cytochrome c oxidase cbb3-type subunit III
MAQNKDASNNEESSNQPKLYSPAETPALLTETTAQPATESKGLKKGEIILREHSFDGIQEYDQRLPNWWLTILWLSIGFFFVYYLIYYSLKLLPTSTESMDLRVEQIQKIRYATLQETLAKLNDDKLVNEWSIDSAIIAKGKDHYAKNCSSCHAQDLAAYGGAAARPLNDGIWEYGNKPMDVFNMILKGTPAESKGYKGVLRMQPWEKDLGAEKIAEITAYLISENPKDFANLKK